MLWLGVAACVLGSLAMLAWRTRVPRDAVRDEVVLDATLQGAATRIVVAALRDDAKLQDEFVARLRAGETWLGPDAALAYLTVPDRINRKVAGELLRLAVSQVDGDWIARNWHEIEYRRLRRVQEAERGARKRSRRR